MLLVEVGMLVVKTYRFTTTSASTSPSTPAYPSRTTSSHTLPSRHLDTSAFQRALPKACLPSSAPSSTTLLRKVR